MKLIIIQGGGASGKSTLAKKLSKTLNIPTFLKDDYKEKQYDLAGKKLSIAKWLKLEEKSYSAINQAIESAIRTKKSLIIEGNFTPFSKRKLRAAIKAYPGVIEIDCYAKPWVAFRRYVQRAQGADRHKGHRDHLWYPLVFFEAVCAKLGLRWYRPLRLSNNVLTLDTSKPNKDDYNSILEFIKNSA